VTFFASLSGEECLLAWKLAAELEHQTTQRRSDKELPRFSTIMFYIDI
jgi:hypothetical protein